MIYYDLSWSIIWEWIIIDFTLVFSGLLTSQNIIGKRTLILGFAGIAFPILHIPYPVFGYLQLNREGAFLPTTNP